MDYEERYKEALERAREQYNKRTPLYDIESIFPELKEKESEEEKIRKELIELISCMHDADPRKKDWLAWLEKQDKKLDADKVIEWLNVNVAVFWANPCNPKNVINQLKKDFGL